MTTLLRSAGMSIAVGLLATMTTSPVFAGVHVPAQHEARHPAGKTVSRTDTGPAPTSAELDDFAHAVVAVGNIKRTARQGIADASTRADRNKREQVVTGKIKAAIRNNHLSVDRYLQIVTFVQAHPAAQKKVVALLELLIPPLPSQQPLD